MEAGGTPATELGNNLEEGYKQWLIRNYRERKLSRNSALYHIAQSLAGDLTVLNIRMKRLSQYIHGFMNDRIYLIGADSGVGKTTITDWMLVSAILDAVQRGVPIKVRYYSWEISRAMKEAKWISMFIYLMYNKLRLSSDYLLGRMPDYLPNEEHLRMVMSAYKQIEKIMSVIEFVEPDYTASEIDEQMIAMAAEYGRIKRMPSTDGTGKIVGYEKHDPRTVLFAVYDHIALVGQEFGEKTKESIDGVSQNAVMHRNMFGISSIFIQQFSTDLMTLNRTKGRQADSLIPQRVDFGDSKYTYRDADIVMGLLRPADFDVIEYLNYPVEQLGRFFIANHLMKNRYGDAGIMCPTFMDYIPGIPLDLPGIIGVEEPDLEPYLKLKHQIETCKESYCLRNVLSQRA